VSEDPEELLAIELDACDSETLPDQCKRHNVTFVLVNEHGPGAGWPVYRFTAERDDLRRFLVEAYDDESGEMLNEYAWHVARPESEGETR
jgi:hypothetical protein